MIKSQRDVRRFVLRHEMQYDAATHVLDLVSEIGELAKLVLQASDYGRQPLDDDVDSWFDQDHRMAVELGDVFYSFLAVAVALDIDAGAALDDALRKYEMRIRERGVPGSS